MPQGRGYGLHFLGVECAALRIPGRISPVHNSPLVEKRTSMRLLRRRPFPDPGAGRSSLVNKALAQVNVGGLTDVQDPAIPCECAS